MKNANITLLLFLVFIIIMSGCVSIDGGVPTKHVLMFNEEGKAVDPTGDISLTCKRKKLGLKGPELCFGSHGYLLPFIDYDELKESEYEQYLEELFSSLKKFPKDPKSDKRKVLIFVHGGLNTRTGSLDRIVENIVDGGKETHNKDEKSRCSGNDRQRRYCRIMDAGYYPIFINWHSSLFSTYKDHLFHIRRGSKWNRDFIQQSLAFFSSPVYFTIDIGKSLIRTPLAWMSMALNDWGSSKDSFPRDFFDFQDSENIAREIICKNRYPDPIQKKDLEKCFKNPKKHHPFFNSSAKCWDWKLPGKTNKKFKQSLLSPGNSRFPIYLGTDCRTIREHAVAGVKNTLLLPSKLLTAPFIDGVGTSAWDNMRRRINLLYDIDAESHTDSALAKNYIKDGVTDFTNISSAGGVSIFMEKFAEFILQNGGEEDWDITLVGHSMGTIVLNQMLREFHEFPKNLPNDNYFSADFMPFSNIVYMGAASTIADFENSVIPYLKKNKNAHFYNLMLHRDAERRENGAYGLVPMGSLLVWVDDFHSNPLTYKDRTLGRFDNAMVILHDIEDQSLRPRIHLKAFQFGEDAKNDPQEHSDFTSKFKFWDKKCWSATEENLNGRCTVVGID